MNNKPKSTINKVGRITLLAGIILLLVGLVLLFFFSTSAAVWTILISIIINIIAISLITIKKY